MTLILLWSGMYIAWVFILCLPPELKAIILAPFYRHRFKFLISVLILLVVLYFAGLL